MSAPLHPDLLPDPAGVLLADPEWPPVPPGCQCRCQGEWNPRIQHLTCGCPPCPAPPADGEEDQRCLPCRAWAHRGACHPHHQGEERHAEVAPSYARRAYAASVDKQAGGCGSC